MPPPPPKKGLEIAVPSIGQDFDVVFCCYVRALLKRWPGSTKISGYQVNFSPKRSLESFEILFAVSSVEQTEHDRERERVLHEVEQAVEGQEGRVKGQKLLVEVVGRKSMPVDFAVGQIVRVEYDHSGEPML